MERDEQAYGNTTAEGRPVKILPDQDSSPMALEGLKPGVQVSLMELSMA